MSLGRNLIFRNIYLKFKVRFESDRSWYSGIFLLILFFSSCNFGGNTPEMPVVYTKAVKEANKKFDFSCNLRSKKFLDSIYSAQTDVNSADYIKYYQFCFNYYFNTAKNNDKALQYANEILVLIEGKGLQERFFHEYIQALYAKGDVLFTGKDYVNGYRFYHEAQSLVRNPSDSCLVSEYSYRVGMILYRQREYIRAAKFFKTSFLQSGRCEQDFQSFYRRQEVLDNIGLCYSKAHFTDSASVYFNNALQFIALHSVEYTTDKEKNLIDVAKGVVYGNQGVEAIKNGRFSVAENLLKKSISINSKPGNDNHDACLASLHLAELYLKTKKFSDAAHILGQTAKAVNSGQNGDGKLIWNRLQAEYYGQKNNYQKAYNFLMAYNLLSDSVSEASRALKKINLNDQLSNVKTQNEINVLKRDNSQKKIWMIIVIVFLAMSLLIIFLVFQNVRRSAKNIKELSSLNLKIKAQKSQLENTLVELENKNKEKDRILRAVAHDLRNPIAGIESLISLLLEEDTDAESAEMLKLIRNTCTNSLEMIAEILHAASPVTADNSQKKLININTLISNCVNLMHYKAAEKNQKIHLTLLDEPFKVFLSPGKISRVITNIISNAIKFTPASANIYVKIILDGENVVVSIADEGIGVPDKFREKIFDMFTPAKRLGTSGEKSFGLGLSISKQIIEAHGGKIWFESQQGLGTTFFLELPQSFENPAAGQAPSFTSQNNSQV